MDSGRFESLGRAIYRAFETDPQQNGQVQQKLLEALGGVKTFLENQLPLMEKSAQASTADINDTRRLVVDNIREEIKWIKEAIAWFEESEKRKQIFDFDQWEAVQANKTKK